MGSSKPLCNLNLDMFLRDYDIMPVNKISKCASVLSRTVNIYLCTWVCGCSASRLCTEDSYRPQTPRYC